MRLVALAVLAACAGKVPETRYYQLASPAAPAHERGDVVLALEPLATDTAYDDERIVYRTSPYRFDYYQYHRWSAPPGAMIGNVLEQALAHTGRFRTITHGTAELTLGGRVVAIEEVDESPGRWVGHLALELVLADAQGVTVWSDRFDETEPLPQQNPEGLARALTVAMSRIVERAAPAIATAVAQRGATIGKR